MLEPCALLHRTYYMHTAIHPLQPALLTLTLPKLPMTNQLPNMRENWLETDCCPPILHSAPPWSQAKPKDKVTVLYSPKGHHCVLEGQQPTPEEILPLSRVLPKASHSHLYSNKYSEGQNIISPILQTRKQRHQQVK